jgi:hypothetical protein
MTTEQTTEQTVEKGRNGGVRPGAGRPKGSPNKITGSTLLAEIEKRDVPFAQGLAEDYIAARQTDDRHLVLKYQQMIMNKVIADKVEIDVTDQNRLLEAKRDAFRAALEHMAGRTIEAQDADYTEIPGPDQA